MTGSHMQHSMDWRYCWIFSAKAWFTRGSPVLAGVFLVIFLAIHIKSTDSACHQSKSAVLGEKSSAEILHEGHEFELRAQCGLSEVDAKRLDLVEIDDERLHHLGIRKAVNFIDLDDQVITVCMADIGSLVYISAPSDRRKPEALRWWTEHKWENRGTTMAEWQVTGWTCADVSKPGWIVQLPMVSDSFHRLVHTIYAEKQFFDFLNLSPDMVFGFAGLLVGVLFCIRRNNPGRVASQDATIECRSGNVTATTISGGANSVFERARSLVNQKRWCLLGSALTGYTLGSILLGNLAFSRMNDEADVERASSRELANCKVLVIGQRGLNVRAEPGPAGDVLRTVDFGSELTSVSARTEHWYEVTHQGISGWISAYLVVPWGDCD